MTEHLPIQRYGARGPLSDPPLLGEYIMVTYADHLAAVAAAEQRVLNEYRQKHDGISDRYFQQIRNDALDAAREGVAALDHAPRCELVWGCECSEAHPLECTCNRDDAIAAIDALREGRQ